MTLEGPTETTTRTRATEGKAEGKTEGVWMMRIRVADVAPVKDEIVMRNATRRTAPKGKKIAWIG
jgi:hypothetical protein